MTCSPLSTREIATSVVAATAIRLKLEVPGEGGEFETGPEL